jgi:hypothetical protein
METIFGSHTQSSNATIHPFHKAGTDLQSREADIEARIRQLSKQIEKLNSDSRFVWLKTGPHIYNEEFDLSVKIEAVRWMLRIAKNLHPSAREALFVRIQRSVEQLESALEASEWSSAT